MANTGREKKAQKAGIKTWSTSDQGNDVGEVFSDSGSETSDASTLACSTSEKQMDLLQASMLLMMKAMEKNEEYRLQDEIRRKEEYEAQREIQKEEVKLRQQELDRLREEAKTLKIELNAKLAAQQARQDAEEQHRIKEDDCRRKYEEKCIKREDENRKTRDEERKREQQERKSRDIVQQIPLWDDKTDVESYLEVFE